MANVKISQLPSLSTMTAVAQIPVVAGGVTYQITGANLQNYFEGTYGNANVVANVAALGSNPVSTAGNVTGAYIFGNGSQLTGLPATYGNANVVANLAALGTNPISTTGNITSGNILGGANVNATTHTGTTVSVSANVTGGNLLTAGLISATGNITSGNVNTGVITLTNGAVIKDNAGDSVAFGQSAGGTSQGNSSVALGHNAGETGQGTFAVAIGRNAGQNTQGGGTVAVGVSAGGETQGNNAIAIGSSAGFTGQGSYAVGIGIGAGQTNQGVDAVAIGNSAGSLTQGIAAVAIGTLAGRTFQANNSIIINATGANLDQTTANTFTVAPVRNDVANTAQVMFYNATSKEVTYGNVISVAGNITGGNLSAVNLVINNIRSDDSSFVNIEDGVNVTGAVVASANITGGYILGNGSQLTGVNAVTVDITDTNGLTTIYYPTFVENRTTAQIARADVNLTYRTDDNLLTVGNVSVTGNIDGGNLRTAGQVSATGNITGGNLDAVNLVINSIRSDDSTFVTIEDGVNISSGAISSQENLSLTANAYTWTFRNDGIGLVLPNSARITDTNLGALAIGYQAGFLSQANTAVAIGYQAALTAQGAGAVAIGRSAGNSQSDFAVAIGSYAGVTNQGNAAVAVGKEAGNTTQGFGAVAIGSSAGSNTQGGSAVALGDSAGQNSQGVYSVAIGYAAAQNNQGASAVAIGFYAGQTSQANNSIILNATGSALNQTTANTFTVAPVRNDVANIGNVMFYNATSKEITYGNVISVAGNITGGNVLTGGLISATGNVSGNYFIGNGAALTGIAASVPGQTILPTVQTITVEARPAGLFGGGQGGANVTVANVIPVTEYGVIITAGTISETYKTGALGSIPGTVSLTFTTGLNSTQYTVFAYVTSNAGTFYSNSATGTSGICLLAGTQIALSDGTHKAIEHITYTDKLLSWDFDRGCYAETTAIWIKRGETGSQYNLLTFSDGTTLRTFDQHRIFNKQAGAFTYPMTSATPVGTATVNEHGQEIILTNKQVIQDTIEYYNVITDYHMNLFSDSVLTSCRFNNIYPITDMKFVKDSRTLRTRAEFENVPDRFFHGLRLAEQTTDVGTVEWYVNRLLSTEVSTESELAV
jgi:hypothetical protein